MRYKVDWDNVDPGGSTATLLLIKEKHHPLSNSPGFEAITETVLSTARIVSNEIAHAEKEHAFLVESRFHPTFLALGE